jgi:hypothetical protein
LRSHSGKGAGNFQRIAENMITQAFAAPYFRDARIRAKCYPWKFSILEGRLEGRILSRMRLLATSCPPRIQAVYFRTLWNGWVCYDRMKDLLQQKGCLLGCGWDDDALGHYICCNVFWHYARMPRPHGLGLTHVQRGREAAMLVSPSLAEDDVVRMAIGLYALYRTVNYLRFAAPADRPPDVQALLRLFGKKGVQNHPAQRFLRP